MKYLYIFFIFLLNHTISIAKSNELKYNHTIYYYNSSHCDNVYKIESFTMPNCNIINKNMCLNYTNSSSFNTCKLINKSSNTSITIILTLLITSLFFLTYKLCCQNFVDNLCICLRDSIYNMICPTERHGYQNNYSSL
jgi:hypothetical protein